MSKVNIAKKPKFKPNDIVVINEPKDPRNYKFHFVNDMENLVNTVRRVTDVSYSHIHNAYRYTVGGWAWNDTNLKLAPIQINDKVHYTKDNGEQGIGTLHDISDNPQLAGKLIIKTEDKRVYVDYENVSKLPEKETDFEAGLASLEATQLTQ